MFSNSGGGEDNDILPTICLSEPPIPPLSMALKVGISSRHRKA